MGQWGGIACIGTLGSHVIPEAIAAGPIAQKLFAKEPKPASEAVDLETLDDSWAKLGPHGEIDLSKPSYPRSDEQKLRIWAMSHCARNPELWAKRLIDTDRDALRELKVNKTSVMNLARALYIRGELKGRDAVEAMYWPGGIEPETHTRLANPTHEPINNTEASR